MILRNCKKEKNHRNAEVRYTSGANPSRSRPHSARQARFHETRNPFSRLIGRRTHRRMGRADSSAVAPLLFLRPSLEFEPASLQWKRPPAKRRVDRPSSRVRKCHSLVRFHCPASSSSGFCALATLRPHARMDYSRGSCPLLADRHRRSSVRLEDRAHEDEDSRKRNDLTVPFLSIPRSRPCCKVTLIEAHAPTMLR